MTFRIPTHVHIRPGCHKLIGPTTRDLGAQRALLVLDPGLQATPWPDAIQHNLETAGVEAITFDAVEPNPRTTTALAAANLAAKENLQVLIGLGGGSAMDAAKAAAMLATNLEQPITDLVGRNRYRNAPLPFIAIPTTCGTGSEVTWVSVLSDAQARTKISIKGESMFPDVALVDADLIRTLPSFLVATTGLDAMTHAIEATTCTCANPVSDALAEKAIDLLMRHLPQAVVDVSENHEAREQVMRAATLAGLAFGNSDVAGVHCLSESLGGMYDVPHGLANAILLVPVMRHHRPYIETRLAEIARSIRLVEEKTTDADGADAFLTHLEQLNRQVEIPPFASLAIPTAEYPDLARAAAANGSNESNPQPMNEASYLEILGTLS